MQDKDKARDKYSMPSAAMNGGDRHSLGRTRGRSFERALALAFFVSHLLAACSFDVATTNSSSEGVSPQKPGTSLTAPISAINASNATTYTVSGTCLPQATLQLSAHSSSGGAKTTLASLTCPPTGTFSISADISTLADGNVSLSLEDGATETALATATVSKDTLPPTAALLASPPATNNLTTLSSGVSTADTVNYSFKLGVQTSVDCDLNTGYSAAIPVATPINENIALIPDGPVRLCLRAQDAAGNWQTTATVVEWTKDASVPTATLTGLPTTDTNIAAATGTVGGTAVTHYRMKFGLAASTDCTSAADYSAETPVATAVNVSASSGNGLYKICLVGRNVLGTWQPFASATSVTWTYDTTAPTLAVTSPAAGDYVTPGNQAALPVTTSCSENGRSVTVTATSAADSSTSTASGTCTGGTVTVSLNLSARPEGDLTLSSSQSDLAGNVGASAVVTLTKDTIAPSLAGTLTDGTIFNSLTTSPTLSWPAASDVGGSGIARYQIAIGTTSGGTQALGWTDVGNATSVQLTSLALNDATTYYAQVRAIDNAGNASSAIIGNGWITDVTPPNMLSVVLSVPSDDWSTTQSPPLTWTAATDGGSGLSRYELAIGSALGLTDILDWTSVGNVTSATLTGLTLSRGSTYHVRIRAVDAAGNTSAAVSGSNAWGVNQELWGTNGTVYSILKSNSTLYLAGSFTQVGKPSGSGVPVSTANGSMAWPDASNKAVVNGGVSAAVADGSGGFFIGGDFTSVGGMPRAGIAHILANGSVDPLFDPGVNGSVNTLVLSGSTLYVGGSFTSAGGELRNNIVAVSITDGSAISSFDPDANGMVLGLLVSGSTLYLGGDFTSVGGTARNHVAAVSTVDGSVVSSFNPNANGLVYDFELSGSTLYLGGGFDTVGGTARKALAAVSTTNGSLIAGFDAHLSGIAFVYDLVLSGSTLYLGGWLSTINGTTRNNLAAVAASDGALVTSFNPNVNYPVTVLELSGSTLYLGGNFTSVGGATRNYVAAVSTTDGSVVSSFNPNAAQQVEALALSGSTLYLGGYFTFVGGTTRNHIAAISTIDGSVISSFDPNASSDVYALALSGSTLYLGGNFLSVGGTTRNFVAAVSTTDGSLVSSFNPNANSFVKSILLSGSTLYLGGNFTAVGGTTRNSVAAVSTTDGALVSSFNPNANALVNALALSGSTLYLGGEFTQVGGTTRNGIAAVSTVDGSLISSFNPGVSGGYVAALALAGSTLYLGGEFTQVGGTPRNNIAAVSTVNGSVSSSFNPNPDAAVFSLLLSGSTLYLGGDFLVVGGSGRNGVAAISTVDGSVIPSFDAEADGAAMSFLLSGSTLYSGGNFSSMGGGLAPGLAPLNAATGASLPAP